MDIRMPGMDGISALTNLRTQGCRTPVILMSGHSQILTPREAKELGGCGFLEKPFRVDDVLNILAELL